MNHFDVVDKIIYENPNVPSEIAEFVLKGKNIHPNRRKQMAAYLEGRSFRNGLEIGRFTGYSAVFFLTLFPEAYLDSIDIIDRPQNRILLDCLDLSDRVNIIVGTSNDIPNNSSYDYVLIDGDHTYEGAKIDWDNVQGHISKGSIILFDDIKHIWDINKSVAHLWRELSNDYPRGNAIKLCENMGAIEIDS